MKIAYILKKGLHHFPPCLSQILYLNDLQADIVVYHGKNSDYVNRMLDERGIEHKTFECDADSKNRFESIINFYKYIKAVNKLVKNLPDDYFLWFGNCESAIAVKKKNLIGKRYLISVLELYDRGGVYDKGLTKLLGGAEAAIACEEHRAAIMRVMYQNFSAPIFVLPNKPYEDGGNSVPELVSLDKNITDVIERIRDRKVILYQGIVTPDRPLDKIAGALKNIDDPNIIFLIMGKASEAIQSEIKAVYDNTIFTGYVPSPQHLCLTQFANVGIANYDFSCLNNLFCAPNKIYEYAKFGIPMLTSGNLGLTETVGACGAAECVDFTSIDDIIVGLKRILENVELYSENARKFYSRIDNKLIVEKILKQLINPEQR